MIKSRTGHSHSLDIPHIQHLMEHHSTVLFVAKIDVDEWVFKEHLHILEAHRPGQRTRAMQHHMLKIVNCIHLEHRGNVLVHSWFAGTRTKLQVAGRAVALLEQALECLLVAKCKVDTEECHAVLGVSWTSLRQRHCGGDSELRTGCVQLCRWAGFVH